jgi:dimethylglycine dehydrogenase
MRTHAQAVVIGGGLIGCSILYHLAKKGWTDCVLIERSELTSGSTWHAAANIHGLHDNTNISRLQHYTMQLYKQLEQETGQSCGIFQQGSLYVAQTEQREHQLRIQAAKARRYGMRFHEISRSEAERLHPFVNFDGIRCIMYEPDGGNVDPSGVTYAYATGARQMGAEMVIAVDISSPPDGNATTDMMKLLLQTFAIMGKSINQFELRDADFVLRPALTGVSSADFAARQRAIQAGREVAQRQLPELKARIAALMR